MKNPSPVFAFSKHRDKDTVGKTGRVGKTLSLGRGTHDDPRHGHGVIGKMRVTCLGPTLHGVIAWMRVTCAVDRGLVVLLGPHPAEAVAVIAWI